MTIKIITPTEVFQLQQESGGIRIIDVRERDEFADLRSPLAVNIPLSTFNVDDIAKNYSRRSPIFVLCKSGKRAMKAAEILVNNGFESVYNIKGGMLDWEASGLPVTRQ